MGYTAQDLVDHLLVSTGGGAQDAEHRAVRMAAVHAAREVFQVRNWLWHTRTGTFTTGEISTTGNMTRGQPYIYLTNAANVYPGRIIQLSPDPFLQSTRVVASLGGNVFQINQTPGATIAHGAIVASVTSGNSYIQFTAGQLSFLQTLVPNLLVSFGANGVNDGVFGAPVLVASVDTNNYRVTLKRADGSTPTALVTSASVTCNFATPTAYSVLAQTYYDLPADVKDIDALITETVGTLHQYLTPQEWQRLEVNTRGAGEPYYYTIMRSDVNPDRWQVRFVGVPTNGTIVNYTYRYIPKELKYTGYETTSRQGTITVSGAPSTTVTGNGTAFPQDIAGCVLRIGTAANDPTPIGGNSPYAYERTIASVSGQTITVTEALPANLTQVKYSISSPLEASQTMYSAMLSAAEMWYARLAGKPAAEVVALFNRDLRQAMENDVVSPLSGRPPVLYDYPTPRTLGWQSRLSNDVG